ncbi:MAG: TonB-dependent receptor [bacterium]
MLKKQYYSIIILFFIFFSTNAFSQTNFQLSGFVKDADNKETLIGAVVYLEGTKYGGATNKEGFYIIKNVPKSKYKLSIQYPGYTKKTEEIEIKANLKKNFELDPSIVEGETIDVYGDRESEKRQITISNVQIPIASIKELRIGGESDVFRTLQYLPGILTSSQLSSGLFVRGGSPDQNLILLDGTPVYNPSHLFGFISTFNTDAIKSINLYKGGFDAEYGGRLSAVLDITQKDGNREKIAGLVSLGVISSRATIEGPIGNGSWFIGGRRTYIDLMKPIFKAFNIVDLPNFGFYDINAKITQNFGELDKVSLSGFTSNDNLDYGAFGMNMTMDVRNSIGAIHWSHFFDEDLLMITNLSYSNYRNKFSGDQSGYGWLIDNAITDYTLKSELEWMVNDKLNFKSGIEINYLKFDYLQDFGDNSDTTKTEDKTGYFKLNVKDYNYSAFSQVKYSITELLSLQTGIRAQYWQLSDNLTIDPRISLRYYLTDKVKLIAAWGIYHQNLRLITQPEFSVIDTWLPTDKSLDPLKSTHYIFSVETEPMPNYDLNVDVYYKDFKNITEYNQYVMSGSKTSELFFTGNAYALGAEIFLQKKYGKLTGWVGYALGFIRAKYDSINYGKEFTPKYDRTHDFKVVAQYEISKKFSVGANFTFQTGQSYTGATSRLQTTLPGQEIGRGKIVPSQRYGLRLPPSHQLNVNASYKFEWLNLDWVALLDIYNVYNRRDIWFRYYNVQESETIVKDVLLLPILPTVSIEVHF